MNGRLTHAAPVAGRTGQCPGLDGDPVWTAEAGTSGMAHDGCMPCNRGSDDMLRSEAVMWFSDPYMYVSSRYV